MSVEAHRLLLLRHGETEWSKSRQHTSRTDLDLTETGRHQAKVTAEALTELNLQTPLVISSPRRRALTTAELAGLTVDELSPLLAEWDYGEYEGLTTPEIRKSVPGWLLWRDGCPGGESVAQVSDRADRAVELALRHMASHDVVFVAFDAEEMARVTGKDGSIGHAEVRIGDSVVMLFDSKNGCEGRRRLCRRHQLFRPERLRKPR